MPLEESALRQLSRRGVAEIIEEKELVRLLQGKRPLRLKMGFDPSRPDIHLGHVVGLRKLRQFQELGHQVILIVGDWTAQIGDPSGQSATRPMLTHEEVKANAETYLRQFFRVVDKAKTQVVWQSEWFGKFTLADVIRLTSRFTVAQFLHREDFWKRWEAERPIAVTELLYPLLQAYDSVAVQSDVEFGGTDQKFNLLVGRQLQEMVGQRPQQCLTVPILVGTDGVQKMSKSLGNYIGVEDPPNEMYGKVMSLPDYWYPGVEQKLTDATIATPVGKGPVSQPLGPVAPQSLMLTYFELLTGVPDVELEKMRKALESQAVNPMELKKSLARELVGEFWGLEEASEAQEHFERVFQRREAPEEVQVVIRLSQFHDIVAKQGKGLLLETERLLKEEFSVTSFLVAAGLVKSRSEAKRLLEQKAIEVDGETLGEDRATLKVGTVIKIGKRKFARIVE